MNDDNENEESSNHELEAEFQALVDGVRINIDAHVEKATEELRKAVALSEIHGVPFRPGISFLRNSYMPQSFFDSKFSELDQNAVCEIASVWGDYLFDGSGWQFSAVC